jgi:hypothetical protein
METTPFEKQTRELYNERFITQLKADIISKYGPADQAGCNGMLHSSSTVIHCRSRARLKRSPIPVLGVMQVRLWYFRAQTPSTSTTAKGKERQHVLSALWKSVRLNSGLYCGICEVMTVMQLHYQPRVLGLHETSEVTRFKLLPR